ncbi:hypothetical protein ACFL4L_05840 [bacterium]
MLQRYCHIFLKCFLLILLPMMIHGQSAEIDSFRLKRDIRIMEGILDKLLDQETSNIRLPGDSKGIYVPDYGMIFYMKKTQPYQPVMLQTLEENINQMMLKQARMQEKLEKQHGSSSKINYVEIEKEAEQLETKSLEEMKSGISEFLSNYASSASLLKNKDRIAVLVHLDGWRSLDHKNGFLTAWVDQKNAEALRQSRESHANLKSDIHFDLKADNESLTKDIDIMTEILDQAMATGPTPRHASTSGLYLNGLGALLFMEVQPTFWSGNMDTSFSIVIHNRNDAVSGYSFTANASNTGKKINSSGEMIKLSDELFDLLASYGHTLGLKPEEQIIIDVNLGPKFTFFGQNPNPLSNIRMQLTKHDLDAYNQGKIDLKKLKKKMILQYM